MLRTDLASELGQNVGLLVQHGCCHCPARLNAGEAVQQLECGLSAPQLPVRCETTSSRADGYVRLVHQCFMCCRARGCVLLRLLDTIMYSKLLLRHCRVGTARPPEGRVNELRRGAGHHVVARVKAGLGEAPLAGTGSVEHVERERLDDGGQVINPGKHSVNGLQLICRP